ncbi:type II toxin-antitoxin system RelE/ParE family toxin [Zavarzinia compransoris]|uniref:type II toxin-antitoxin system RelE/ParE family toxin n=1 Tax=Zavarzinia marina TaxID=2911065 RepID=UPI001F2BCCAF|nr:type II toxin-antitoxin system RelE/ParE family toxin [Zavarzinia marina]MCF4166823.1 type II toxin-antitoxin system RelE/ParE family toxin [Zavarzinia marina]
MLPIVWLKDARDDLHHIITYIAADNPAAARRMKDRIESVVLPLSEHPYMYRKSDRMVGLREAIAHPSYAVLYRVTTSRVEIVAVTHTSRLFP